MVSYIFNYFVSINHNVIIKFADNKLFMMTNFWEIITFFSFSLLKMNLDEYFLCYASKYRVYFGDNIAKRLAISLLRFWTTICDFRPNNIIYFILFIYLFLRKNKNSVYSWRNQHSYFINAENEVQGWGWIWYSNK